MSEHAKTSPSTNKTVYFYDNNYLPTDTPLQSGELTGDSPVAPIVSQGSTTKFNVGTVFTQDELKETAGDLLGSAQSNTSEAIADMLADPLRASELTIRLGAVAAEKQMAIAPSLEKFVTSASELFEQNLTIVDELQDGIVNYNYTQGTRNTIRLNAIAPQASLLNDSQFSSLANTVNQTNMAALEQLYSHYGVDFNAAHVFTRPSEDSPNASIQLTIYPLMNGTLHFAEKRLIPNDAASADRLSAARPPYVEAVVGVKDYSADERW